MGAEFASLDDILAEFEQLLPALPLPLAQVGPRLIDGGGTDRTQRLIRDFFEAALTYSVAVRVSVACDQAKFGKLALAVKLNNRLAKIEDSRGLSVGVLIDLLRHAAKAIDHAVPSVESDLGLARLKAKSDAQAQVARELGDQLVHGYNITSEARKAAENSGVLGLYDLYSWFRNADSHRPRLRTHVAGNLTKSLLRALLLVLQNDAAHCQGECRVAPERELVYATKTATYSLRPFFWVSADPEPKALVLTSRKSGSPEWEYVQLCTGETKGTRDLSKLWPRAPEPEGIEAVEPNLPKGYEHVSVLGTGGMATVFLARETRLERVVAIKRISLRTTDPATRKSFEIETGSIKRVQHANIVKLLTTEEDDNYQFIVLEYVRGADLAKVKGRLEQIRRSSSRPLESRDLRLCAWDDADVVHPHPLPRPPPLELSDAPTESSFVAFAASLFVDVALAIQKLHDAGVIHRDIKPANLILSHEGDRIIIADFGIAKVFDRETTGKTTKYFAGTLRYAAPERLPSSATRSDHRVDIYGLGATMFELLTGDDFHHDDRDALRASLRRAGASLELTDVVCRATEPHPNDRQQSARQLAHELRKSLGLPTVVDFDNTRSGDDDIPEEPGPGFAQRIFEHVRSVVFSRAGVYALVGATTLLALAVLGRWWCIQADWSAGEIGCENSKNIWEEERKVVVRPGEAGPLRGEAYGDFAYLLGPRGPLHSLGFQWSFPDGQPQSGHELQQIQIYFDNQKQSWIESSNLVWIEAERDPDDEQWRAVRTRALEAKQGQGQVGRTCEERRRGVPELLLNKVSPSLREKLEQEVEVRAGTVEMPTFVRRGQDDLEVAFVLGVRRRRYRLQEGDSQPLLTPEDTKYVTLELTCVRAWSITALELELEKGNFIKYSLLPSHSCDGEGEWPELELTAHCDSEELDRCEERVERLFQDLGVEMKPEDKAPAKASIAHAYLNPKGSAGEAQSTSER